MKRPGLDYEPFLPKIQRLDRSHRMMKLTFVFGTLFAAFWVLEGRAWYRRFAIGIDSVPERQRTGDGFLAVSFPRITKDGERMTMSRGELEATLRSLKKLGFLSVGVRDIVDFYEKGRPLPPKPLLVAFERDNPESVDLADSVLKRVRMKGLLFLNKTPILGEDGQPIRQALSPHAIGQLRKSGAWDMGWSSDVRPTWRQGDLVRPPVIDMGEPYHAWTRNPFLYPVRFIASRTGYNDSDRLMAALRVARVRTDRPAAENVRSIAGAWPRKQPFVDDFKKDGLAIEWVSERGVVVTIGRRMVLVPTPKQTSASAYLSGTDTWRDCVAEMTLSKYRRDAWLYGRASEGRWVRVGVMNGYWYLQQKTGPEHKPVTIARAPMNIATTLPARVRLVLKGPWAIVHVNGRMQYGKAVRLHPGIDQGRVELDTYDEKKAAALAVVTYFAAAPINQHWLSLNHDSIAGDLGAEQRLVDAVRERAVYASVLSPRWLDVLADGRVAPVDDDRELVRSLAGYYRCLLVPMVDFASPKAVLPASKPAADRMLEDIVASLKGSEAAGVNIKLSFSRLQRERASYFLARLRVRLHEQKRRLWVTLEGSGRDPDWLRDSSDGLLRPVSQPVPGASVLEWYGGRAPKPGSA